MGAGLEWTPKAWPMPWSGFGPLPASARIVERATIAAARMPTPKMTFPRLVKCNASEPPHKGAVVPEGSRGDATSGWGGPQTSSPICGKPPSHLLEDADPVLDGRMGGEQLLQPGRLLAGDTRGLVQPEVCRGVVRRPHGVIAPGVLPERGGQPWRVPGEHRPLCVGQVFALPGHRELDDLRADRREDQEEQADPEQDGLARSAAPV